MTTVCHKRIVTVLVTSQYTIEGSGRYIAGIIDYEMKTSLVNTLERREKVKKEIKSPVLVLK
jgi:hypothetical protein